MIAGVGIDIVDLASFEGQLADRASGFVEGTFTSRERDLARLRPTEPARHLAARFAAKEAFVKAFDGARFGLTPIMERVDLREVEVVSDAFGRPGLRLHGRVADAFDAAGFTRPHLSLTHDGGYAAAVVTLERLDPQPPIP